MRTVSFSDDRVQATFNKDFVCCFTNTQGDPSAGASFSHAPSDAPGPCGRGAGRQNVQTIFLTPDNKIFHLATGYMSAKDLLDEAAFAKQVYKAIQRSPKRGRQTVVQTHGQRLKQMGFSSSEIAQTSNPLGDMMLTGPNPQDFGINMPRPSDFGVRMPGGSGFGLGHGGGRALRRHGGEP